MEFITFLHSAEIRERVDHGEDLDRPITLAIALPTARQVSTALLCATLSLPAVAPLAHAQDVPEIAILQELLASRGFDPGSIDGIKGDATTAAILQAQAFYGLTEDGIVGAETLAALQRDDYRASSDQENTETPVAASDIDVSTLQNLLAERGFYEGAIDGIAGEQTMGAILKAQAFYGLTVDGIAGSDTLAALEADYYRVSSTTKVEDVADTSDRGTFALQELLASRGFYRGRIDGIVGSETENAILAAQGFYGLEQDGIVGSQTLAALEADTFFIAPNS